MLISLTYRIPEVRERCDVPPGLGGQEASDDGLLDHHVQDEEAVGNGKTGRRKREGLRSR